MKLAVRRKKAGSGRMRRGNALNRIVTRPRSTSRPSYASVGRLPANPDRTVRAGWVLTTLHVAVTSPLPHPVAAQLPTLASVPFNAHSAQLPRRYRPYPGEAVTQ